MDLKTQWDFFASWMRARFADSDRGATMVEYALMVALIAVVCIAAVSLIGTNANTKFSSVGTTLGSAS
jgi:pilus assembly protein Flp/PilA